MPGIDYQAVRLKVSMQQVLELLGFVPTTTRGQQAYGVCSVRGCCKRRRGPFSVNLAKHNYRCLQCGSQGNQLDLWTAATKQQLFQAAVDLCHQKNIEVPGSVASHHERFADRNQSRRGNPYFLRVHVEPLK